MAVRRAYRPAGSQRISSQFISSDEIQRRPGLARLTAPSRAAAMLLAGLSFVAVLFTAAPVIVLSDCR